MNLNIAFLGRVEYGKALELQRRLQRIRIEDKTGDLLLVLEHPPVLTMGRRTKIENILAPKETLDREGIPVVEVERGGDVTYHGPGQMVGYPIVRLGENRLGIRAFVEAIGRAFIDFLGEEYGVEARAGSGVRTGVWVGERKITAIGLSVSRGVTMHGFAFNVSTDLRRFDLIVPCGLGQGTVTSLEQVTGQAQDFSTVCRKAALYFCQALDREPVLIDPDDLPDWEEEHA